MLLERAEPIYRQIALHFEKEIFEGRLKPGEKLPSTRDLAKSFDVNPETIQTSLKMLADRGLIERKRKCGSFVRRKSVGKCLGIAVGREIFGSVDMAFFCLLFNKVTSMLESDGWSLKLFVMTREKRFDKGFYEMESAISDGSLDALLEICTSDIVVDWLEKHCTIPYFVSPVSADYADFIRKGFAHLHANGRRNPVLIYDMDHIERESVDSTIHALRKEFNLERSSFRAAHSEPAMDWGYRVAKGLFEGCEPFDSLLVLYDNTFRGVLYYIMEKGLRIPDDIAVVSHSNRGVDLFCHVPLTRLEFDPDDFARDIIKTIEARLDGRAYESIHVKPRLVKGLSCGEGKR